MNNVERAQLIFLREKVETLYYPKAEARRSRFRNKGEWNEVVAIVKEKEAVEELIKFLLDQVETHEEAIDALETKYEREIAMKEEAWQKEVADLMDRIDAAEGNVR